jgi:multiple antibiotic resistance protein
VAAFQIGGGLLILLTAITMMGTQPSRGAQQNEAAEASEKDSVAVVPLATPLLAGPGAISTAIIFTHQTSSWLDIGILVTSSVVMALLSWIALRSAIPISNALGKTGINIATRLMGLLLAAIAAEFICTGLRELLLGLK